MKKINMNVIPKDVTLKDAIERFIKYKTIRNLSKESLKYYQNCMDFFG